MSEVWQIALFTAVLTIMTGILGWIGYALWSMNSILREFVTQPECDNRMGEHCSSIGELRGIAVKNQKAITAIVAVLDKEHGYKINY